MPIGEPLQSCLILEDDGSMWHTAAVKQKNARNPGRIEKGGAF